MKRKLYKPKLVILGPLLPLLAVFSAMVYSYMHVLNKDIEEEYRNVNAMLQRAGKIVVALDYGLTKYYESSEILSSRYNLTIEDGLCKVTPKESTMITYNRAHSAPPINISYMMVGDASICAPKYPNVARVLQRISLAPILSFLQDLDDYVIGVHYIDNEGFVVSAPKEVIKNITKEQLVTVKLREFWQKAAHNPDVISVTGPSAFSEVLKQRNNITLTMPVYQEAEFQGVVVLNVSVDLLIGDSSPITGKVRLVKSADIPKDGTVYKNHELKVGYTDMDHNLYYHWDWKSEAREFVQEKKMSLTVILLVYLVSVVGFFLLNTRVEKSYYAKLAAHDPMTGLLNRRGLEEFLKLQQHKRYLSIAVLDIDDFKSVNDTYGHDVGDEVICYLGQQIEKNIRDTDAVARFGGEEFVVYLTGENRERIENVMNRVKDAITKQSTSVIQSGFTVSGGVEIIESEQGCDFEPLFKIADEKLYEAKTTGKDKLVF